MSDPFVLFNGIYFLLWIYTIGFLCACKISELLPSRTRSPPLIMHNYYQCYQHNLQTLSNSLTKSMKGMCVRLLNSRLFFMIWRCTKINQILTFLSWRPPNLVPPPPTNYLWRRIQNCWIYFIRCIYQCNSPIIFTPASTSPFVIFLNVINLVLLSCSINIIFNFSFGQKLK